MYVYSVVILRPDSAGVTTGNIYPMNEVEKAYNLIKENGVKFKFFESKEDLNKVEDTPFVEDIIYKDCSLDDNGIRVSFSIKEESEIEKKVNDGKFVAFACGEGEVDEDHKISDYDLKYITLMPAEDIDTNLVEIEEYKND